MRNKRRRESQKKGWTSGATKDGDGTIQDWCGYYIPTIIHSWTLLAPVKKTGFGIARGQRSMLFSVWKVGDIFKSSNYLLLHLLSPSLSLSISQGQAVKTPEVKHIVLSSSLLPVKRMWVQTEVAAADALLPFIVIKQQSCTYKVKGLNTELSNSRNMITISRKDVSFCFACQSF